MARKKKEYIDVTDQVKNKSGAADRLDKALLYKALLSRQFLEPHEAETPYGKAIEQEIKSFLNEKLEILLGMRPEPVIEKNKEAQLKKLVEAMVDNFAKTNELIKSGGFSDREKLALKALATAVVNKNKDEPNSASQIGHDVTTGVRPKITRTVISSEGKEVEMDLTGQVIPKADPDRLPMADQHQMATLASNHIHLVQGESTSTASGLLSVLTGGVNNLNDFSENGE